MKTGMKRPYVWILMLGLSLASCGHRQDDRYAVDLQETAERVCYPLSVNTTLYIKSLSVFTDEAGREHLVFMLWGAYAKEKSHLIDGTKHLILTASHPSPRSAEHGFFGCRHFSRANAYLRQYGIPEIVW